MQSKFLQAVEDKHTKADVPDFQVGDTIIVHQKLPRAASDGAARAPTACVEAAAPRGAKGGLPPLVSHPTRMAHFMGPAPSIATAARRVWSKRDPGRTSSAR